MTTYIRQPNSWSCLPASLANLTGLNYDTIIKLIGHDGSKIVEKYEGYGDPGYRQAFNDQEIQKVALKSGIILTPILPNYQAVKCIAGYIDDLETFDNVEFLRDMVQRYDGIMCGTIGEKHGHAVSWINKMIIDPKGSEYPLSEKVFDQIEVFWAWVNK